MFTIYIGENPYYVSGCEAAWFAFQTACAFADSIGGMVVNMYEGDTLISTNEEQPKHRKEVLDNGDIVWHY